MPKGTIRRLMDRGFGFIKTEDETDLFSIATSLREWNLIALAKDRKWNLRRVRDVMVAPQQLRCGLSKLKHPMMAEMTKAEIRTRPRHRTTHVQRFITRLLVGRPRFAAWCSWISPGSGRFCLSEIVE